MRILPHNPDRARSDGRRLRSMPELWTNRHFTHAGARYAADIVAPGTASLSSRVDPSSIPNDGGNGDEWGHAIASTKHRLATKTLSRATTPHSFTRWNRRPDALGDHPSRPWISRAESA